MEHVPGWWEVGETVAPVYRPRERIQRGGGLYPGQNGNACENNFPMLVLILIAAPLVILWARLGIVASYRSQVLALISHMNNDEIDATQQYDGHRYQQFREVSFNEMLFQFWRPCKSFFEGRDFQV